MKLGDAVQSGDIEEVKRALASDATDLASALQMLWDDARVDILKLLLAANPPERALGSALINAAGNGRLAFLHILLAHPGALTPASGVDALASAASAGQTESVRRLLAAGVDPNPPRPSSRWNEDHPLTKAIDAGHADIVRALLDAKSAHDFLIGFEHDKPLDRAKKLGRQAIVDLLVAAGAKERTDEDLDLPSAAGFGRIERVRALLPPASEEQRGGALTMAAQAGHLDIVALLLPLGVPKKPLDDALAFAAQNGHDAVVAALLAAGASPEAELHFGRRALMAAVDHGHTKVIERLLAAGADPNARDEDGDTAIDRAKDTPAIHAMLVRAGADPDAKARFVAEVKQKLAAFARPAWIPMTDFVEGEPLGSRYGGLPWLEEGEAWPRADDGRPLAFLVQINLDEAPDEIRSQAGGGLLQLFLDLDELPYRPFSSGQLVRIVRDVAARKGGVAEAPEGLLPFNEQPILLWDPVTDTPFREVGEQPHHRYRAAIPKHADELLFRLNVQDDKLGGWASWVQSPEYPKAPGTSVVLDRLLFQINSQQNLDVSFGDSGVGYIVQSSAEPDRVAFLWQCG